MLETDKNKDSKKKQRLGRGLGSLFGDEISEPGVVEDVVNDSKSSIENKTAEQKPAPVPQTVAASTEAATAAATAVSEPVAPTSTAPAAASAGTTSEPAVPPQQRIWTISIDKIIPNKDQPRKEFDQEKIRELANSIKTQGILQPIVARKLESGQYEIIAGERRWRAAQAAGVHEVPVILKEADNKKVMEWALIENIQREDLNPLEEAEAYNLLIMNYKYTHQELADKMGKERATVSNALRLLTLPREVRELVREQKLSQGHAKALLSLEIMEQQKVLAKQIIDKGLSVRAVEKEVARIKKGYPLVETESTVASRQAESMATELQKVLGTKVKIDYADGKGKITVHFFSDDEFTSLVEKMKGGA